MKKLLFFTLLVIAFITQATAQNKYRYVSVPNDPMKVRIYTLDNGLKVYLSVYKDAPRIQTMVAVRTGSKNDPHDNTGMSHYLEHMMFKGTDHFGTRDFAKEQPYLNQIEDLFEKYRSLTDTNQRKAVYHVIDSISGVAAGFAIANEYDKMLGVMGAKGTNAFTGSEMTVYINDIPSNQLDRWLAVESERYRKPVFRLFHTELETVYEEKNMSLDSDDDKLWEALYSGLFQKHTYGTQTTIGTVEHLKNPSLKALRAYYESRYVPNNMAIILSGDFDPEQAIAAIDATFGKLPMKKIIPFVPAVEDPITKPLVKEVLGPDAESMVLGFRCGGADTRDEDILDMISQIMNNGTAGLVDLNLIQDQKVLEANVWADNMKDYSALMMMGKPKQGQSLEQVRDELLGQLELVKQGKFPDWMLPAIINEMKLNRIKRLESNMGRSFVMMGSFIFDENWEKQVEYIDRLSKITKKDIVDFANANFKNNYVIVYKKTGVAPEVNKVTKPKITPVEMNRDETSDFVKKISSMEPKPIEPVFIDYQKDIVNDKISGNLPLYYLKNNENSTFNLYYLFDMGTNHNKLLGLALDYLNYLGTSVYNPKAFKEELYKAGCSLYFNAGADQVYVSLNGLSENLEKGLSLFESLLKDPVANKEALSNLVADILKKRSDDKLSKQTILWSALTNYGIYGDKSSFTNILSESELKSIDPEQLLTVIRELNSYPHRVMYYGTHQVPDLKKVVLKYHQLPKVMKTIPQETKFVEQENSQNKVYVVDYDMKQVEILCLSTSDKYDKTAIPAIRIFNEYFGGSMASIVFQELREARALAYSAYAGYRGPTRPDRRNYIFAYIGTQNDKLPEAMKSMMSLFNSMPESPKSFQEAKDAVINKIRTERITKTNILFNYESARRFGLTYDIRKDVYEKVPAMQFTDLKTFEEQRMKNKNFNIMVLGKKDELDIKELEKYGPVTFLTLEQIFGY